MLRLSLGCGIGYGYLHRIPTRPVQLNAQNESVLQPEVTDSGEQVASVGRTEVQAITYFFCLIYELLLDTDFKIFCPFRCLLWLNLANLVNQV